MASLLQTFRAVAGSRGARYVNLISGDEISRRQYVKQKRAASGETELTNEALAKFNRQRNELEQLARPARGRSSALKLAPPIKADVVKARKEIKQQIATVKKATVEQKKIDRKVEQAKRRKIHVKKFSGRLLKPGHRATRIAFNDYEDMEKIVEDMRKSKIVFAYGLGINGVDARTGQPSTPTVFRMMAVRETVDEEEFYDTMNSWMESRGYFVFVSYFMHIHYEESYSAKKAKTK